MRYQKPMKAPRYDTEQLRKLGYELKDNAAVRLPRRTQPAEGTALVSAQGASGKKPPRSRKMVLQKLRCRVRMVMYAIRPLDADSLAIAGKYILDGLVGCGLLEDDSYAHVLIEAEGIKMNDKTKERVEVTIEPIK